jgi:hypothetical protein
LSVEVPTKCPFEFASITTVIVKGATPEWFEENVPDHVPLTSVAAYRGAARITAINDNEKRSKARNGKNVLVIVILL